ncbi:DUF424 domain-containing protein [Candidatus Pacearchaeota archaeon]|jgi:hypothetical protein|nr:DUF424 domain-containing protein [Candidatus Pacearchaeota archaeon]
MLFVKVIKSYRDVVAICDSDLIGKNFEEGKFQLEVKDSFFRGEETNEEKAAEIIRKMVQEDATFNIVGKNSVNLALKEGIIKEEGIKMIQGIPFALVLI